VNKYIEDAINCLRDCDEDAQVNALISIAQSLDRIAVAQERLADSLRDVKLRESLDKIEYNLTQIRW
jgi:uncharacterized protein with PhoU and TrkA domain